MKKIFSIFLNCLPVFMMIVIIPLIPDDYVLLLVYLCITALLFRIRLEKNDVLAFILGLCVMTMCEYIFVSTGVETFNRISLLGAMPIWLPVLWAYSFVTIKRVLKAIES